MKNKTNVKFSSIKNIRVDSNSFFSFHDNENNQEIFKILKSEDLDFYRHTDVKKPKSINDINKYIENSNIFFDIFYKNKFSI